MPTESNYKLRKRIRELLHDNSELRRDRNEYRDAVSSVFDAVTKCDINSYVPPLAIVQHLKPLVLKTRVW